MSTYAVGHHESVLRSHRWRTAPDSAGYLHFRLARRAVPPRPGRAGSPQPIFKRLP